MATPSQHSERKFIIYAIFSIVALIFIIRLVYVQVINTDYRTDARNNSLRELTVYPSRGLIYDRNNQILVHNERSYDLMIVPKKIKDLDTLALCKLIGIDTVEFNLRLRKAKEYSYYKPSIFEKQISGDADAELQEKIYKFHGFFLQPGHIRKYPNGIGAHVLGYLSEVSQNQINQEEFYSSGDIIGSSGLEYSYEKILRGVKGKKIIVVDNHNREMGDFMGGKDNVLPEDGLNLVSSLDANLQAYGELLMKGKRGSIVAIEPKSGEVLSMVSSPTFDPNLLVGRMRSKNYKRLLKDTLDPLFNRSMGSEQFPPGSTFKTIQALIGQQEGVIDSNSYFPCNKSLVGCHNHASPLSLQQSIQHSCNPYYYNAVKRIFNQGKSTNRFTDTRIGLETWREYILSFGLGRKLGIDLPGEKKGTIPSPELYDKYYGKGRWNWETIYSLAIGQGEIGAVPLQMANVASIIANKGYYYIPHVVKSIEGDADTLLNKYQEKHYVKVSPKYFDLVINGMYDVVSKTGGTARRARIDSLKICGKTGTSQNPFGEDHSLFIAFAPKDNPKIAIAVYVENKGSGGLWAAPIASLMIEKYLRGTISVPDREESILNNEVPIR